MRNEVKYDPINGKTIQVSDTNTDYTIGDWVAGIDDTVGYVIVSDTTTLNAVGSGTGGGLGDPAGANMPVFWQSTGRTDNALIDLLNKIPGSPGMFTDINTALMWLSTSPMSLTGYNNNPTGTALDGDYFLFAQYSPAMSSGSITFPNHEIGTYDLNPNHVGQYSFGMYDTQLYINKFAFGDVSNEAIFNQFVGKSGTLTLTQGSNSVTYAFTNQAFENSSYGGTNLYADNHFENSVSGSITVISPASGEFNTTQPITISYTLN